MTTRHTKKSAPKSATKTAQETKAPNLELAAPEQVMRHELLGICDFALVDPGARMPAQARQALFELQKGKCVHCVMQCGGYVFNVTALPYVTFIDRAGQVTGSSEPKNDGGTPTAQG